MKVLVKQHVVPKIWIVLQTSIVPEHWAMTVVVAKKDPYHGGDDGDRLDVGGPPAAARIVSRQEAHRREGVHFRALDELSHRHEFVRTVRHG